MPRSKGFASKKNSGGGPPDPPPNTASGPRPSAVNQTVALHFTFRRAPLSEAGSMVSPKLEWRFLLQGLCTRIAAGGKLQKWGKKNSTLCPLCSSNGQSLQHILNNCPTAMDLRRYSARHDEVLKIIVAFANKHLLPSFSLSADLPNCTYLFPHHITPTNQLTYLVWWSDAKKVLWLLELTVSFETSMHGGGTPAPAV